MSDRVDQLLGPWGWETHPTFNDRNPYNGGPINPYGIGLIFPIPYGNNGSKQTRSHTSTLVNINSLDAKISLQRSPTRNRSQPGKHRLLGGSSHDL